MIVKLLLLKVKYSNMISLLHNIRPEIQEGIFLKNPESSALGKRIVKEGVLLIDEIGFEAFTFKKLGERIQTNESSVYRYFENKHKFLLYISSWYWSWMECRLVFETANLTNPVDRLMKAILLVTEDTADDILSDYLDESVLKRIIISDFTKTFLTKEVDDENREGFFKIYKRVIYRIAEIIKEVKPVYSFPESLASNIVEGAMHQHFLKQHFKTITSCNESVSPADFYINMVNNLLIKSI
jgi:AcrR family transcriptional regulator